MANKLIRIGYTQIVPANPGRPPTPPRTITTTMAVGGSLVGGSGGSWVYEGGMTPGELLDKITPVWVPTGGSAR